MAYSGWGKGFTTAKGPKFTLEEKLLHKYMKAKILELRSLKSSCTRQATLRRSTLLGYPAKIYEALAT